MSNEKKGVSRRTVVAGAAATSLLPVTSLADRKVVEEGFESDEADIIILGSGLGACTAALVATQQGQSVIMLEKADFFGGTTSKSGGVIWVPNNPFLAEMGLEDKKDDALAIMVRHAWADMYDPEDTFLGVGQYTYDLLAAMYEAGPQAVNALNEAGVKIGPWTYDPSGPMPPDYLDHVPENKTPRGRTVGHIKDDGSIGMGVDLTTRCYEVLQSRGVTIELATPATSLLQNKHGQISGVFAAQGETKILYRARKAVIAATGGFAHNPALLEEYHEHKVWGACAMPSAQGDLIPMAKDVGASFGNMTSAWRMQVLIENALKDRHLFGGAFFPPGDGVFQVNKYGVRVANEKRNYNDRTYDIHFAYDEAKGEYPNSLMFMIYDQRTADLHKGQYPYPPDDGSWGPVDWVISADTLEDLSAKIDARLAEIEEATGGIRLAEDFAVKLKATTATFNAAARAGKDAFGRGDTAYDREWSGYFGRPLPSDKWEANELPNPVLYPLQDEGPYHAMILGAGILDTNGGPRTNTNAEVLAENDAVLEGFYAVGNCMASPTRETYYAAGGPLGLTLSFGYIAGMHASQAAVKDA